MNKFIFCYKHSLGPYYNLIATINDDGIVDYEYSYCSDYIYEKDKTIFVKESLNKELSKQFIEYIDSARIEDMDKEYYRQKQVLDNAPECNIAILKDSNSAFVYVETDSYPDTFKYIIKALDLINKDFTYWYRLEKLGYIQVV